MNDVDDDDDNAKTLKLDEKVRLIASRIMSPF